MTLIRKQVHDGRVAAFIKKYRKSGVMEGGVVRRIKEGTPGKGLVTPFLGHSTMALTEKTYIHVFFSLKDVVASKIDGLYDLEDDENLTSNSLQTDLW